MRGFLQHIVPFDDLAVLIFDRPGTDPEGGAQAWQAFAPDILPDPFASRFEQEFSSGIETSDLFDKFLGEVLSESDSRHVLLFGYWGT